MMYSARRNPLNARISFFIQHLSDGTTRTEHISEIYSEFAELLVTRTTVEWLALFDNADAPAMALHSLDSLMVDAHLEVTSFFSLSTIPAKGGFTKCRC